MLKGFRDFVMRGNVIDLAIAVVIGAALGAVVSAFAKDFIGGIIGAIGGTPDFGGAGWTVNKSKIIVGSTINALIYFVIVAAAIYFFIVVPLNRMAERRRRGELPEDASPTSEELLAEIRDLLRAQAGPTDVPPRGVPPQV